MAFFGSSWKDDDDDEGTPHFTNCSGECKDCLIHYVGGCISGHGDDDFMSISEDDKKKYNLTIRKK